MSNILIGLERLGYGARVELTVLGKSNSWPDAGGACSGYLLTEGDYRLMLDCGSGAFAKLREVCPYESVDAIVISHLHADHFLDLIPFSFALNYSERGLHARPRLYGPPGTHQLFERLGEAIGFGDQLERAFEVSEYHVDDQLQVGPFKTRFCEVPHYIQTFACEFVNDVGTRFTFGADCAYNEQLIDFASQTDLLLVEATESEIPDLAAGDQRGHMTAHEAGQLAQAAGARRALVAHFSDELDAGQVRDEATAGYGARVEIAEHGARLSV